MHSLINDYAAGLLGLTNLHACRCTSRRIGITRKISRTRSALKTWLNPWSSRCDRSTQHGKSNHCRNPFRLLPRTSEFWNHTLDGLAVLGAPSLFRVYRLQRLVPELVVVADSFHLKPLIRIIQSADRYQVLGLNRREIKLYRGESRCSRRDRAGSKMYRALSPRR